MTYGDNLFSAYYNAHSTAKAYVQDGLIAMWDGIENAGWGVHDGNATAWKDLIGGREATLVNASFGDNAMLFPTSSYAETGAINLWASNVITLEFIFTSDVSQASSGSNAYPCVLRSSSPDDAYSFFRRYDSSIGDKWEAKVNTNISNQRVFISPFTGKPFWVRAHDLITEMAYYDSMINISSVARNDFSSVANYQWRIGCDRGYTLGADAKYHALRIYNRALSNAELMHNYAIDKARFNIQ